MNTEAWWTQPADHWLRALASSPQGLTDAEAARRLPAQASVPPGRAITPALRVLLRQFKGPLVLILLAGALLSLALREWTEAMLIGLIVLVSAGLGFWQELGATRAVEALRNRWAVTARVLRDGRPVALVASQVVPGDVVELRAGHLVPADGIVLQASGLQVNQASLSGESFPVDKRPGATAGHTPLPARDNALYAGTSVHSGSATMLVLRTGPDTELARLSRHLAAPDEETDFERGVRRFGVLLLQVMLVVVIVVLLANQWQGRALVDSLLFAVALAVGLSPEMLPAIVTVSLARSAKRLARDGVLVRRLDAIEDLGGMQVLLTDKTGTLTTGALRLALCTDAHGTPGTAGALTLQLACLNARFQSGIDNPIDQALLQASPERDAASPWRKRGELAYDFRRRRLSVVLAHTHDDSVQLITKGAVREVLAVCDLDDTARAAALAWARAQGEQGLRVLAVAQRRLPLRASDLSDADAHTDPGRWSEADEHALRLAGFIAFEDPVRPEAAQAVHQLAAHGIRVAMVTGDSRHVAQRVAREVGLAADRLVTGEELARISDDALWHHIAHTTCFAEVEPAQKERIVRALQRHGRAVGFLGDGINDAAALRAADVGIAVPGAVDVARESADLALLHTGLDVIQRGVHEGRRTFVNTLKYIQFTLSANFGNMLSMALVAPWLPFLPMSAGQILLNNFLSDLPALALATDRVDAAALRRARRWKVAEVRRFMAVFGLLSSGVDLLTFWLLLQVFGAPAPQFHAAWFLVSLLTELGMLLVLRTRAAPWRHRPGPWLAAVSAGVALAALAITTVPALAHPLGFAPLPLSMLATLLAVVLMCLLLTEAVKRRLLARAHTARRADRHNHAHESSRPA